jgi:hypothetical protein
LAIPLYFCPSNISNRKPKRIAHLIQLKHENDFVEDSNLTPIDGYYAEHIENKEVRTVGLENISLYELKELQIDNNFCGIRFY